MATDNRTVSKTTLLVFVVDYSTTVLLPNSRKSLALRTLTKFQSLKKSSSTLVLAVLKMTRRLLKLPPTLCAKLLVKKPVETIAKNSIAGFKLREGNKIGLKVTLRGDKMYEFLDRLD